MIDYQAKKQKPVTCLFWVTDFMSGYGGVLTHIIAALFPQVELMTFSLNLKKINVFCFPTLKWQKLWNLIITWLNDDGYRCSAYFH